jgi:hypothetical protein
MKTNEEEPMYLRLTAKIEGDLYFSEIPLKICDGDIEIKFKGDIGRIEQVSVTTIILNGDEKNLNSDDQIEKEKNIWNVSSVGGKVAYRKLEEKLQSLESIYAFFTLFGLRKIWWEYPKVEILGISEDGEHENVEHSFEFGPRDYQNISKIDQDLFKFASTFHNPQAQVLTAFWREGKYHQIHNRFIESIYNFYFIIEDSILGGKSTGVEKIIRNKPEFVDICKTFLSRMIKDEEIKKDIIKFANFDLNEPTPENISKFITNARGNIHHFNSKQKDKKPFPYQQENYYHLSMFFELVTWQIIHNLIKK